MNRNLERFLEGIKNKQNFLLFDLEANCIDDLSKNTSGESFIHTHETIQFGYIKFDYKYDILSKGSIFVMPKKLSTLSDFIKNLTGITQEQVNAGVSFPEGLSQFLGIYDSRTDYIMSYGNYDMKQIYGDCALNAIPYPFDEGDGWHYSKHINIKNALASKLDIREKGMEPLIEMLGLELKGKHHNGEDDCMNILSIIRHVFGAQ